MERTRWYKDKVFYQIWPRSFKDGKAMAWGICGAFMRSWII